MVAEGARSGGFERPSLLAVDDDPAVLRAVERDLRRRYGERYEGVEQFFLESNFATDKKSSQVNMLRTRGKRVVAEASGARAPS